jgi:hypothetical protein
MEIIQEQQQETNTIVSQMITHHQVQDLYNILNHSEIQDTYACIKNTLYSLLQHPDQEYHIVIKKLGYKDPIYHLSINNIYDGEPIPQAQAITWHDLLQWAALVRLMRKYKPKS